MNNPIPTMIDWLWKRWGATDDERMVLRRWRYIKKIKSGRSKKYKPDGTLRLPLGIKGSKLV